MVNVKFDIVLGGLNIFDPRRIIKINFTSTDSLEARIAPDCPVLMIHSNMTARCEI